MIVKDNQPGLKEAIESLDSLAFSPLHTETNKGHGRIETRSIKTSTELNEYLEFPHVGQVAIIYRHTTNLKGQPIKDRNDEAVCAITSLSETKADPAILLSLNRNHWAIENKVHYVRDVSFDEDRSRVRKNKGAHMMATLRNVAISLLRIAGFENIAAAVRHCIRRVSRPLRLIGIVLK